MPSRFPKVEFQVEGFDLFNSYTLAIFLERIELARKSDTHPETDMISLFRMQLFYEGLYDIVQGKFKEGVDFNLSVDEINQLKTHLLFDTERSWDKPLPLSEQINKVCLAIRTIKGKLGPAILARLQMESLMSGVRVGAPSLLSPNNPTAILMPPFVH